MAWIVYNTSSTGRGVVSGAFRLESQATAHRAALDRPTDWAVLDTGSTAVPSKFSPGDWYWRSNAFTPDPSLTDTQKVALRRATLKTLLRQAERVQGLSVWTAGSNASGSNSSARSKSYSRWVEANARASSIDANLTNDDRYAELLAECSIDGRTWYWLHWVSGTRGGGTTGTQWSPFYTSDDRSAWTWYKTVGDTIQPNSRGGVVSSHGMSLRADASFNWVSYLADD